MAAGQACAPLARMKPYRASLLYFPDVAVAHFHGRIIAPGFVDIPVHYPQRNVIGSPAEGLLQWLKNYTFPHKKRFLA